MPDKMDAFEREERCRKAIRSVARAVIMRMAVIVLMIFAAVQAPENGWVWGLMAFVLIITISGLPPLVKEWKARRAELKEILSEEE